MGHHGRKYRPGGEHGRDKGHGMGILRGLSRGSKIILTLVIVFVLLVVTILVILVLAKPASSGESGFLQSAYDFFQRNVQSILVFWKTVQNVTGK